MHTSWQVQLLEATVVAVSLLVLACKAASPLEWLGSAAVFTAFLHLQVQEEARGYAPTRTTVKFFLLLLVREALWIAYFYLAGTYAAIIGALFFALFPFWRQLYYRVRSREECRSKVLDDTI